MPAAAVIPAPKVHAKVVAVKKLVVGSLRVGGGSMFVATAPFDLCFCVGGGRVFLTGCPVAPSGLL